MEELASEGERAAVVLGAARIDVELEKLLRKAMRHSGGGSDNLFDPDRPLGTFSAKIALAHRLNLIDNDIEHALQMLRKVRNDFAHSVSKATLSESHHKNRVKELVGATKKATDEKGEFMHTRFSGRMPQSASEVLRSFCAAIFMILLMLEITESLTETFVPKCKAAFE
ncbi:MAG: hypothetical protein WA672_12685 [Candidatus Angelobacter sp.]